MKIILRNFARPEGVADADLPKLVETAEGHIVGNKPLPWKQDFSPNTYRYYVWSHAEEQTISVDSRFIIETREGFMAMATLYGHKYDASGPIACVFFGDTIEDSVMLINQFCVTDLEYVMEVGKRRRLAIIADYNPKAKELYDRYTAKRKMLAQLNIADSAAMLEKQVDILSQLVFTLADKLPAEEQPSWYAEFKTAVTENASVAPDSGSIQNMLEGKAFIRKIVGEYLAARG